MGDDIRQIGNPSIDYQTLLRRMSRTAPEHLPSAYHTGDASTYLGEGSPSWSPDSPVSWNVDLSRYGAICNGLFSQYHPSNIQRFGVNSTMRNDSNYDGNNVLAVDSIEIFGNLDENQPWIKNEGIVGNIYFFLEPENSTEYSAIRRVVEKPTLRDWNTEWLDLMRQTFGGRTPISPQEKGFHHHFSFENADIPVAAWSIVPGAVYDDSSPQPHEWSGCERRIHQQEFAGHWQRINYSPIPKELVDLDIEGFNNASSLSLRIYESDGKSGDVYNYTPLLQAPIVIKEGVGRIVVAHDVSDENNVFVGYYDESGKFLEGDDIIALQAREELFTAVIKMSIVRTDQR